MVWNWLRSGNWSSACSEEGMEGVEGGGREACDRETQEEE